MDQQQQQNQNKLQNQQQQQQQLPIAVLYPSSEDNANTPATFTTALDNQTTIVNMTEDNKDNNIVTNDASVSAASNMSTSNISAASIDNNESKMDVIMSNDGTTSNNNENNTIASSSNGNSCSKSTTTFTSQLFLEDDVMTPILQNHTATNRTIVDHISSDTGGQQHKNAQQPILFPDLNNNHNDQIIQPQSHQNRQQQQQQQQVQLQQDPQQPIQVIDQYSQMTPPTIQSSNENSPLFIQHQQQQQRSSTPNTLSVSASNSPQCSNQVQIVNPSPNSNNTPPLQPQLLPLNQQQQQLPAPITLNATNVNITPPQQQQQQQESNFESILNSPKKNDEIVEKSPGGRYIRFSEKLGSGAYKDVYRAYDTIEGIEVAWNVVNLTGVPKSDRQYIVNEVRLLEKLNHSNIISFHGSWVNRELEQVIFVTEILSSGTLKSFITKVQVIRWRIAKRWAKQILKGLEYLHSHDPPIVHRDLKCDNIFINGTSGDLRIGDLGLSTVISNSSRKQVLSVLGTPEFMAPDLYNESYDQTVDIYAFGMCMLEIFTKEIPYRECSNPAQIYKKVMAGVEPESLNRIRSVEAREFIRLCLGRPDGQGGYIRPSCGELLNHPFLAKKDDDDTEVLVDPPIIEVAIPEGPVLSGLTDSTAFTAFQQIHRSNPDLLGESERAVPIPQLGVTVPQPGVNIQQPSVNLPQPSVNAIQPSVSMPQPSVSVPPSEASISPNVASQVTSHQNLDISSGSDEFVGIPDQESNIKNVTVLMGRGQQMEVEQSSDDINFSNTVHQHQSQSQMSVSAAVSSQVPVPPASGRPPKPPTPKPIGWVVNIIELNEFDTSGMPYSEDILQLRLTLALGNPHKQVQFDFHLVNDDPIAVAHEMVSELNLPQEAVLEISERISWMARSARVRQDQFKKQSLVQQQSQLQQQVPPLGSNGVHNAGNQMTIYDVNSSSQQDRDNSVQLQQLQQQQQSSHVGGTGLQNSSNQLNNLYTGNAMETVIDRVSLDSNNNTSAISGIHIQEQEKQSSHLHVTSLQNSSSQLNNLYNGNSIEAVMDSMHVDTNINTSAISSASDMQQQLQQHESQPPLPAPTSSTQVSALNTNQINVHDNNVMMDNQVTNESNISETSNTIINPNVFSSTSTATTLVPNVPNIHVEEVEPLTIDETNEIVVEKAISNLYTGPTLEIGITDDDETTSLNLTELKELKEEFEKRMSIVNKAYQTRLENLLRSNKDKEALHMQLVEKHEKERLAFEKKVRQAEKEQQERVQKLADEFEQMKAKALQSKQLTEQDELIVDANVDESKKESPSATFSMDVNGATNTML